MNQQPSYQTFPSEKQIVKKTKRKQKSYRVWTLDERGEIGRHTS